MANDANMIYNEIIGALESYCNEPLYPGDERRIFGEALVAVFVAAYAKMDNESKQKMLKFARGEVLDALGERTQTARMPSLRAKTVVRFSVALPRAENILIPAGTKVTADGSLYFATDHLYVLQAGTSFVDIPASGTEAGIGHNGLLPGSITTLVDLIPYIAAVSNTIATYGGSDGEPYTESGDEHYRERVRLASAKFSTAGPEDAYEYYALSADPGIISVKVNSPAPGCVTLVPLMEGGNIPTQDILDKVIAACNPGSIRPLTDMVTAAAPAQVPFDIAFKYYITAEDAETTIKTIEGAGGAIERYITAQTTVMGRDVNPDLLRRFVLRPDWEDGLVGAVRMDVLAPVYTVLDELSVSVFSGNLTVEHEVVEE